MCVLPLPWLCALSQLWRSAFLPTWKCCRTNFKQDIKMWRALRILLSWLFLLCSLQGHLNLIRKFQFHLTWHDFDSYGSYSTDHTTESATTQYKTFLNLVACNWYMTLFRIIKCVLFCFLNPRRPFVQICFMNYLSFRHYFSNMCYFILAMYWN